MPRLGKVERAADKSFSRGVIKLAQKAMETDGEWWLEKTHARAAFLQCVYLLSK